MSFFKNLFNNLKDKNPKDINKNDIIAELKIELVNQTTNLTNIINEQITNITSSVVNDTATYISQHTGGHNKIKFEDMTMGDTTAINLEQVVDIKVTNQAVIQILTNTQIKTDYSSKLSTQLQNSTTSNSTFNTAMKNVAGLTQATKSEEGFGTICGSVMDTIKSLNPLNNPITTENIQKLQNNISQSISNITLNETTIKNLIHDTIETNVKNMNAAVCNMSTIGDNQINFKGVTLSGSGKISLKQVESITALNSCVQQIVNNSDFTNKLDKSIVTTVSNAVDNTATFSLTNENEAQLIAIKEKKDAIAEMLKNPYSLAGIIIIAVLIFCCVVGMIYWRYTKSKGMIKNISPNIQPSQVVNPIETSYNSSYEIPDIKSVLGHDESIGISKKRGLFGLFGPKHINRKT